MARANNPYRCAIYWTVIVTDSFPEVTVCGLTGLIRFNRTASMIWLLSDGHHSEEQIFQVLKERFPDVSAGRLREEVGRFLTQAESRGLLVRHWDPLQPYRVMYEGLIG